MSLLEAIATFFGVACVWLTIRQNIWCWPAGLVQVTLYIFIFFSTKLYADMMLHVIYVVLGIYGWMNWRSENGAGLRVSRSRFWILWMGVVGMGTAALGYSLVTMTDASQPFIDSFVVMSSLVAQWLMAKKKLESWIYWIIADITAIGLYAYKELYLTSGLYVIFLVLAFVGHTTWRKDLVSGHQYRGVAAA